MLVIPLNIGKCGKCFHFNAIIPYLRIIITSHKTSKYISCVIHTVIQITHVINKSMYSKIICLLSILNKNSKMFFCSAIFVLIHFLLNKDTIVPVRYHRISSGFFWKILFVCSSRFFQKLIPLRVYVILNNIIAKIAIFTYVFRTKIDDNVNNVRSSILDFIRLLSHSNWWCSYQI